MKRRRLSRKKVESLKFVKISDRKMNVEKFPDFLIIGPQRTGSTWVYENLAEHPQVCVSKIKEVHFFTCLHDPEHPLYSSNELSWYLSMFEDQNQSIIKKLFSGSSRKIYGEASATSAIMGEELIKEIIIINPDIKVIILIRNPVDTIWSHAKMHLITNQSKKYSDITIDDFIKVFQLPHIVHSAKFTKIIDRWSRFLKKGNIFIGQFDDIRKNPEELLSSIFDFLEIENKNIYYTEKVNKKINFVPSNSTPIPKELKDYLETHYKNEKKRLKERYNMSWD